MTSGVERLARMEVQVEELKASLQEHKADTARHLVEINDKLDGLLTLRNKGAGVVWLVSGLIGTGLISGMVELMHYLFGGK
jgi:hypothetical protein